MDEITNKVVWRRAGRRREEIGKRMKAKENNSIQETGIYVDKEAMNP